MKKFLPELILTLKRADPKVWVLCATKSGRSTEYVCLYATGPSAEKDSHPQPASTPSFFYIWKCDGVTFLANNEGEDIV